MDAANDENIRILHMNMLFPIQSVTDSIPKTDDSYFVLMKANILMDMYLMTIIINSSAIVSKTCIK